MKDLTDKGSYSVDGDSRSYMSDFAGIFANESEVADTIRDIYGSCGYVIDTHTAVAAYADRQYKKTDNTKSVIISTASPYKFAGSVLAAIDPALVCDDDFEMAKKLSEISKVPIPDAISSIKDAKILHDTVCTVEDMKSTVKDWLGLA